MEKTVEQTKSSWALDWILANRDVINVRGLEAKAGLPWKSLQAFADGSKDGYFPKKWIPALEKFVAELNSCSDNSHNIYADKLVDVWKSTVKERRDYEKRELVNSANMANAKAEQVIDDLVYFYQSVKQANPGAAEQLAARINARAGKSLALKALLK